MSSLSPEESELTLAPVRLLIFQGTPFCNIDCTYCYLPNRTDKARMSLRTVDAATTQLAAQDLVANRVDVLWHAGEPLTLSHEFYEEAFGIIDTRLAASAVRHKIQTNGLLITDRWIELFQKWRVSVGISLDGPPDIHDRYRRARSGAGTSDRVLEGADKLKSSGLGLSVICVLTKDSIEQPHRLFDFFEDLGVEEIAFNIDEAEGPYLASSHDPATAHVKFRSFLLNYFQLVISSNSRQRVRELTRGLMYIFRKTIKSDYETLPISILTVGHDGTVGTFSPELFGLVHSEFGPLSFGNVHDPELFGKLRRDARLIDVFKSIQRGIDACERECGYFEICKGGMPANKLGEHGTFEVTETLACRFKRQAVADAAVEIVNAGLLGSNTDDAC